MFFDAGGVIAGVQQARRLQAVHPVLNFRGDSEHIVVFDFRVLLRMLPNRSGIAVVVESKRRLVRFP